MQDIINSFKAHLYERTSSPLIGSFLFYWFICNYKLVMVILDGDMKLNDKFKLIKTLYPQNIWTPWEGFDIHYSTLLGNGLLMPLLITLAYIFIIPYPAKFVYSFWKNKQKEIQEIKQKIDDETPLTKEQSKKIREDFKTLESLYYENLLNSKETEANNLFDKEKDDNLNKDIKLNDYEVKILKYLSDYPNHMIKASSINDFFKETQSKTDYFLDKLTSENFLTRNYSNREGEHQYGIYQRGREYLVVNQII